jgi:amino acid adenylation domain-containing protein
MPLPAGETVLDVFRRSVDAHPSTIAVRDVESGERLSYQALDALATRLARRLKRLGVGPEVRVGLCVQNGASKVWGMLGILLSGGVYVPLDARLPSERLLWMMQDAGIALVLTEAAIADALPEAGAGTFLLDVERAAIEGEGAERFEPGIGPAHAAYMIYTSGTSGLPKAVVAEHRGLRNLSVQGDVLGIEPGTHVLEYASLSFDASVFEIFLALAAGATLHVGQGQWVGDELWSKLHELEIEVVTLPPSVLITLERDELSSLRTLVIAGEACGRELSERWGRGRRLINAYGPTEGTVWATFAECSPSVQPPVIGGPIRNADVYVLDERLEPVPCGVMGELWLAGELLTRGYAKRPDLTAERFVPNPHGGLGERMYRTGDRARWLEHFGLEFVGRRDDQIKLRGHRVELGEVEAVLRAQPGVEQAAVVCVGNETAGAGRLVGYFSATAGTDTGALTATLSGALARQLPEHMRPTLVLLGQLPLSRNGKVDKSALPSPEQPEGQLARAPQGPSEERLAEILRPLLGGTTLDMSKSFFAQGGHSLSAMLLLSRIRAVLGVELTLRELNAAASLSDVALSITASRRERRHIPRLDSEQRRRHIPLSFAQQRLWIAEQLNPGTSAYNIPAVARIRGAVDAAALAEALSILARRQTALRTAIRAEAGTPYQLLLEQPVTQLEVDDWSNWNRDERERRLQELLHAEQQAPFDWQAGCLLRARLVRCAEREYVLALTVHHVLCDAWSLQIVVAELIQAYERVCVEGSFEPDSLALDYLDYAAWQRASLERGDWDEALTYWRGKLAGRLEPLALPCKAQVARDQSNRGAQLAFEIDDQLHADLTSFCRAHSCTLFEALTAAFAALLKRYSGQDELLLLTPAASRPVRELEGVVGFFLNNLVLRLDVGGQPSFGELLTRVRDTVRDARAHDEVPLEHLVASLELARVFNAAELFQVMLSWQSAEAAAPQPTALSVELLDVPTDSAKFPLSLALKERERGIAGSFEYQSACFDSNVVQAMADHFVSLLQALCRRPEQGVASFALVNGAARQAALSTLDGPRVSFAPDLVHEVIAKIAAEHPLSIAVEFAAQQLSYEELEATSNQLAHYLRAQGVGPDVVVGVWLERSLELPAVLLGILKAGGAYLPLDTELPPARVARMLDDGALKLIVSERRLSSLLPETSAEVLCLDEQRATLRAQPTRSPCVRLDGGGLAYVLYTSGSTGAPKPIAVSHSALLNHMQWLLRSFELGPEDRVLQKTVTAFDASVWELFAPLMVGGCLCLAEPGGQRDPGYLVRAMREHAISVLQVVPTLLEALVREPGFGELDRLRLVFCGGEVLSPNLVRAYSAVQRAPLCNLYGPTEACIDATAHRCAADDLPVVVPIGRPIWNLRARVLDAEGELVPPGVVGELFLGGAGLARGYLGHADWTAARFVPDAFGGNGERLYRTGDLVRYRASGLVEYVGRADGQVKAGGHRIEVGDVESALERQPSVARAVVVAKVARANSLVAYVTLRAGAAMDEPALLAALAAELPLYMLPRQIVFLADLPLSVNGKLDRRTLAERDDVELGAPARVAPETGLQAALWRIWAGVLGSEDFGIDDNFIGLGGDSIKAVQVSARARTQGFELNAKNVLECQTLRRLAYVVTELGASTPGHTPDDDDFPELDADSVRRSVERIQKKREQT